MVKEHYPALNFAFLKKKLCDLPFIHIYEYDPQKWFRVENFQFSYQALDRISEQTI